MAVTYYALLTTVGAGKLANATALGTTLKITQLAVGDGGGSVPTPDASRTALVNEVRRAPLNQLSVDPANAAQIIAEQVIPEDVGGWWIREMGLYDEAGALIAYANCAPSYKPQLAEGSGRTQTVRMVLIVSNTGAVELKIDPSVVLATRAYVDTSIADALGKLDYKQSARYATTGNVNLSGLATQAGGDWPAALTAGDRVLVSGLCYGGMRFYDQGGLRGKKAALSFTLGGRPHMFGPDAIHGELDMLLRPLLRGTLAYVGMDVLPFFAGYHVPYLKPEAREQIMQDYRGWLASLPALEPLVFPKMGEFDEKLYPRK